MRFGFYRYEFNLISKRDHVSLLYKRSFSDRKQLNLITVGFEPRTFKKVSILNPRCLKGSRYLIFDAHKVIIGAASPFFKTDFLINSDSNLFLFCIREVSQIGNS